MTSPFASVTFFNKTDTPVWVTFYGRDADTLNLMKIKLTHCVKPRHNFTWDSLPNSSIKIQAEAQKGHGNLCNTGTYWAGTIDATGDKYNSTLRQTASPKTVRARLLSHPSGATTLDWF